MDEENIYDDLDDFILDHRVEQVQGNNKDLQKTIAKLEETTRKFSEEIAAIQQIKQNLERNISALFKTAKNEIERKDKKIADLTRQLDTFKCQKAAKNVEKKVEQNALMKELHASKSTIEQKNRIIQSLTKELEYVKKDILSQDNRVKRKPQEDDDLRNRLGKKRKLDDKSEYRSRRPRSPPRSPRSTRSPRSPRSPRPRSRSKHRYDRRNHHSNDSDKYRKPKHSRSKSPLSKKRPHREDMKKSRSPKSPRSPRTPRTPRSPKSSSIDCKKHEIFEQKTKFEAKFLHNVVKEDSGMSSSNSQTSELIVKSEAIKPATKEDLEEGEIDCSLEDIHSEKENMSKEIKPPDNTKDEVLELTVQNNYLDDLNIVEEIDQMRMEDDKRKKRREDKERISKLRTAISECKQNIQLLEHRISSDEDSEPENDFNKTGVLEENCVNNLVLKISKGSIVHNQQTSNDVIEESDKENLKKEVNDTNKTENAVVETTVLKTTITEIVDEGNTKTNTNDSIDSNTNEQNNVNVEKKLTENETERKAPLKAKRRRAFICIT